MSGPAMIQHLPVAEVDILGAEDGADYILAGAALAESLSRTDDGREGMKKAAMGLEDEQLLYLAAPADHLLKVVHKLAMALRLAGWALNDDNGYAAPLNRLLGSALSDVIVLRHAEMRRRELVGRAAAERADEARETRTETVA
jgi:hypothetical protein